MSFLLNVIVPTKIPFNSIIVAKKLKTFNGCHFGACAIKLFTTINIFCRIKLERFSIVTVNPSLIFAAKVRSLPLNVSLKEVFTWVDNLVRKTNTLAYSGSEFITAVKVLYYSPLVI